MRSCAKQPLGQEPAKERSTSQQWTARSFPVFVGSDCAARWYWLQAGHSGPGADARCHEAVFTARRSRRHSAAPKLVKTGADMRPKLVKQGSSRGVLYILPWYLAFPSSQGKFLLAQEFLRRRRFQIARSGSRKLGKNHHKRGNFPHEQRPKHCVATHNCSHVHGRQGCHPPPGLRRRVRAPSERTPVPVPAEHSLRVLCVAVVVPIVTSCWSSRVAPR